VTKSDRGRDKGREIAIEIAIEIETTRDLNMLVTRRTLKLGIAVEELYNRPPQPGDLLPVRVPKHMQINE
jgi:hypothetical protein